MLRPPCHSPFPVSSWRCSAMSRRRRPPRIRRLRARFCRFRRRCAGAPPSFALMPRSNPRCSERDRTEWSASRIDRTMTPSTCAAIAIRSFPSCTAPFNSGIRSRCLGPIAGYDAARQSVDSRIECWQSIHFPFRTAAELGLPDEADVPEAQQRTTPCVMSSGNYWAHVMIRHPASPPTK